VVDLPSSGTVVAIRRGDDTAAREYSPPASPVCLFGGGWWTRNWSRVYPWGWCFTKSTS